MPVVQNNTKNVTLLAMPTGQFQTFCLVTNQTHNAPVTKLITSTRLTRFSLSFDLYKYDLIRCGSPDHETRGEFP
jgi:hypothetical protein